MHVPPWRVDRAIVIIACSAIVSVAATAFDVTLNVRLGDDEGQGLGTVFQATDDAGAVIAGAGFDDGHSTYLRDNHRQVVFFVKSDQVDHTVTAIGKPYGPEHNGTRLVSHDGHLIAMHRAGNAVAFHRLEGENLKPYEAEWTRTANAYGGVQLVNNKLLVFEGTRIRYDGVTVYESALGSGRYYYANGKLLLYHANPDRLYVVSWKPGETVTLNEAESFDIVGNVFTFGTFDEQILIATNVGEFYSYSDGSLTCHRRTDGKSWQGYSMLRFHDRTLIGHYPSGSLYQYDENGLKLFEPRIPVPQNVSSNAREAQTLAIYRGDLYAGVWPWGEIWRFDHDANEWSFVTRVFESPAMNSEDQEPFARAMKDKPAPYNYWGQRVTSLTNFGDSLYVATMNKQGKPLLAEHDFLDAKTVAQYGAVYRLHLAGQIAAPFEWKTETTLRFVAADDRLAVYQDGALLEHASMDRTDVLDRISELTLGSGVYGPFRGTVVRE